MPSALLPTSTYERGDGNFPPFRLINVYAEKTPTSDTQVALISRHGLSELSTDGSGPINGMFAKKGTFGGDLFTISGTALYRAGSAVSSGTIAGSGHASFAGSDTEVLVTRGSTMRSYKAAGIADVTFPDSAAVRAVCFIGSLFVALRGDGAYPGRFYWSALLDGRTWDALDYATAEREPDDLLDIAPLGDNIWLFGEQTLEAWAHTGDSALPFTRLENVAFDKGIHSTGAQCRADNSIFFVGSDRVFYRIADVPTRVSDHSIEERINASTTVKLFSYKHEGHEFVCIRLDTETLCFDCATQQWTEYQTDGGQWSACDAVTINGVPKFGHDTTGQIMGLSGWDDLGAAMERRFPAAVSLDTPASIDRVSLWANVGQSSVLSGQGSDPVIEMRHSDDAGQTWSDWDDDGLGNASLGGTGMYRTVPEWRALGMFDFPGLLMEFRVTDPVPFRVSSVKVNDPAGGRQRV